MWFKREKVESFTEMRFSVSGMRSREEFEAVCEGSSVRVTLYVGFLCSDEERKPESVAVCDLESFIAMLNDCEVMGWDGFHGKHPKHVRDGIMFSFEAIVNGGRKIHADGSENFPKGFHELRNGFSNIIKENSEADRPADARRHHGCDIKNSAAAVRSSY